MENFINESIDMRRKYNIEEEEKLLSSFPQSILEEFRKETNISIFHDIPFFKHLSNKYLQELAVTIERRLAHPEEIILNFKKIPNIVIISGGQISLNPNCLGYRIHGKSMQKIKLKKKP